MESSVDEPTVSRDSVSDLPEWPNERKAIGQEALELLEADYLTYRRRGAWFFGAAFVVGIALIAASVYMTSTHITKLEQSHIPDQMLIFLLVRGTFFGGLSIAFIYGLFTMANAYIDQATRFRKRLYSAHMLNYSFERFGDQIVERGNVTLPELVAMFGA